MTGRAARGARRLAVALLAAAGASCASRRAAPALLPPDPPPPAPAEPAAGAALPPDAFEPFNPADYRLAVGDVVEVSVFGLPETAAVVPIAPDGKLYYGFTGGVPAAGRRPPEVAGDIERRVNRLFNNPRVDVLPQRFAAQRFLVLGKVRRPGAYPLNAALTMRQALAEAGGLAQGVYRGTTIEVASLKESYLLRGGQRVAVDFDRLVNGNDAAQDIYVRPGDVLYIASGLSRSREVYLLGAVTEQKSTAYRDHMTIVELLAGASDRGGGTRPGARLGRVVLLRGPLEDPRAETVDVEAILRGRAPDRYLQPGDIVFVPDRPFRFARDLARTAVLTFVRAFVSEAGAALVLENVFPDSVPRTLPGGTGVDGGGGD